MVIATMIHFEKKGDYDKSSIIFRTITPKNNSFFVRSFENGIVTIETMGDCTITDIAEIVAGCFVDSSNFEDEVNEAFCIDKNAIVVGINIKFHGLDIMVTKENADVKKIIKKYEDKEAQKEFENQQYEIMDCIGKSYVHSHEYRTEIAQKRLRIRYQNYIYGKK